MFRSYRVPNPGAHPAPVAAARWHTGTVIADLMPVHLPPSKQAAFPAGPASSTCPSALSMQPQVPACRNCSAACQLGTAAWALRASLCWRACPAASVWRLGWQRWDAVRRAGRCVGSPGAANRGWVPHLGSSPPGSSPHPSAGRLAGAPPPPARAQLPACPPPAESWAHNASAWGHAVRVVCGHWRFNPEMRGSQHR